MNTVEFGSAPEAPQTVVDQEQSRLASLGTWAKNHVGRIVGVGALSVGALTFVGAEGLPFGSDPVAANQLTNNPSDTPTAAGCAPLKKFEVTATEPSIFGQMYTQKSAGKQQPYSANRASDQIMAQACNNEDALVSLYTVYGIYENQAQIPQDLGSTLSTNAEQLVPGSSQAQTAESNVLGFANMMTKTTAQKPFPVIKGATVLVSTDNGLELKPASLPSGTVDGYVIAPNDQSLTALQQQRYDALSKEIIFTTAGTIIFNETLQNATINLNTPNNSPQNPNTQVTQTSTPNSSTAQKNAGNSGAGGSSPTEKVGNAGGAGTAAEGTQSGQSGTGNAGPGGGGAGGGAPGGETPSPTPTTTPETVPPTVPPTTTPTTQPPTTTTTAPKPPNPVPTTGCTDPFNPACH